MTREEAINEIKSWAIPSKTGREVLETLIPELRESEDEKMMKNIRLALLSVDDVFWRTHGITEKEALAYLEKQKEQKPIEDVVKDITKNKESAIKFLKSAGIMDDNGELAEMYRSEQKPVDYEHEMWKNCEANFEGGKKEVIDHPEKYGLQKSAEWSEEDETRMTNIIIMLEEYLVHHYSKDDIDKSVAWLKSLRPSWKPNEEQMEAFRGCIEDLQARAEATVGGWDNFNVMISLYEELKKL